MHAGCVVCGVIRPQRGQLCGVVSLLPLLWGFWGSLGLCSRRLYLLSHAVRPEVRVFT